MQMPMSCGRFSVRALRRFTILSPFQIEEVPEHVFAPEVAAASDHSSVEINCEIHPGLMTEGVEGPLRGFGPLAEIYQALAECVVEVNGHHGHAIGPLRK